MNINQFDEVGRFEKAVREDRIEDAELHLDDLQERLEDVKMERKERELNVEVKHCERVDYNMEGRGSFVAYEFCDKTNYVTGNTIQDALIKFGEDYGSES